MLDDGIRHRALTVVEVVSVGRQASCAGHSRRKSTLAPQVANMDLFGDVSVVALRTPGHTPGRSLLLVRLKALGPVLLSADPAPILENHDHDAMPAFNFNNAQTTACIQRIKHIHKTLKVKLIKPTRTAWPPQAADVSCCRQTGRSHGHGQRRYPAAWRLTSPCLRPAPPRTCSLMT